MEEKIIIDALRVVVKTYGKPLAIQVEKIFRNETAHFKSGGFALSLSPGMEALTKTFPYGWSSLKDYWTKEKSYAPSGTVDEIENSSAIIKSRGKRTFVKFADIEGSMMSVANIINLRGGDGARWFSNDNGAVGEGVRKKYNAVLNGIIPRFVNTIN